METVRVRMEETRTNLRNRQASPARINLRNALLRPPLAILVRLLRWTNCKTRQGPAPAAINSSRAAAEAALVGGAREAVPAAVVPRATEKSLLVALAMEN
jgi:hypothetical protein